MQINSVMIVIFTIMLTDLAAMNVNTHVLQDLISLLKVSDYLSFVILPALILFPGKIIRTCNFIRIPVEPEINLSVCLSI